MLSLKLKFRFKVQDTIEGDNKKDGEFALLDNKISYKIEEIKIDTDW